MKKKKIYSLRVLGETVSKNIRNDDFYTTDTDTWLEFSLVDKTLIPETMSISLVNSNDGSAINEVVTLTETKTILFRLDPEIIVHAGTWQGQVVFEANGEMYTSKSFAFGVLSNVMDNNVPQLIKIANFKHFKQMLEELTQQGEEFEENELARESAESGRVNTENSRVSAESGRVSAEQTRVNAENVRKGFYEGFTSELNKKANKQQEAWVTPTMLNGWVNYSETTYAKCGYYKDTLGIVHLRGFIKSGEINKNIFSLPSGYQPEALSYFPTTAFNAAGTITVSSFSGNVICAHGTNTWVSLDGISFKAYR